MNIIKYSLIYIFFVISIFAKDFTVGTYNVENLFDMNYDKSEYKEFIPNSPSNWNNKIYQKKLENVSFVIKDMDLDILALQEIESLNALQELLELVPKYKFYSFLKDKSSAIGVGVISKYPIISKNKIDVHKIKKYSRPILEVDINIEDKAVKLFVSHWRSKRAGENYRIEYAYAIAKRVKELSDESDYIILGDLNSNYDEFQTFKDDKSLNTSYEITGINQVLNTTIDNKFITKDSLNKFNDKKVHYNLWLELPLYNRYSYKFRGVNQTPDNIIISKGLIDGMNIEYVDKSFRVFNPNYLFKKNQIYRWQMKNNKFLGEGFSDHLPIYAKFSSSIQNRTTKIKESSDISSLYLIDELEKSLTLNNLFVIYKSGKSTIIKEENSRAIFFYDRDESLNFGESIDIKIDEISTYFGQKEIKKAQIFNIKKSTIDIKNLYLDATKIDLFDNKFQNEVITNLKGFYKKGYLYYDNKKIRVYAKDITLLPKDDSKMIITNAHLTNYKLKPQIKIYSKSDYFVVKE